MKGIKTIVKSFFRLVLGMYIMLAQTSSSSSSSSSSSYGIVDAVEEHVHVIKEHVDDDKTAKKVVLPPLTFLRGRDVDSETVQQYHHHHTHLGRSLQAGETYVVFDFGYGYANDNCGGWTPEFSFSCLDANIVVLSTTESIPNIVSCDQNGISGIDCHFVDTYGTGVLPKANVNIQFACVSPSNNQRQTSFTASGTSFKPSAYSANNQPSCLAGGNVNHLLSLSYYDPQSGMVLPEYSSCQQGQPFPIEVENQNPLLTCTEMGVCPFDSIGGCETFLGPASSIITIEDGPNTPVLIADSTDGQPTETSGAQDSVGGTLGSVPGAGEGGGQDSVGEPLDSIPTSGDVGTAVGGGASGPVVEGGGVPFSTDTSTASAQFGGGVVVITTFIILVQGVLITCI